VDRDAETAAGTAEAFPAAGPAVLLAERVLVEVSVLAAAGCHRPRPRRPAGLGPDGERAPKAAPSSDLKVIHHRVVHLRSQCRERVVLTRRVYAIGEKDHVEIVLRINPE
jgi:hypothetical protein